MTTSIRLDPDLNERLSALADTTHRSKSYYLREMIRCGLEDLEDAYSASMITTRIAAGKEKTYSFAETEAQLGLDA
jgi:RHH-type transcriptional regulator, rel operon repressor / antitoxin RelB